MLAEFLLLLALASGPSSGPTTLVVDVDQPVDAVAEFTDGKFTGWHTAKPDEAAGAVRFEVKLSPDGRGGMMASIKNAGPSFVKLKMELISPDGKGWMETSSCPVGAGMHNFESWPHPIGKLLITDVRILKPNEKVGCE